MARVMKPAEFQECPPGTVFGYGGRWDFGALLILEEIIIGQGYWGFYACDPLWVDEADGNE